MPLFLTDTESKMYGVLHKCSHRTGRMSLGPMLTFSVLASFVGECELNSREILTG